MCAALQVRAQVGERDGVTTIVRAMKQWSSSGGVQCNSCLAIVSRGLPGVPCSPLCRKHCYNLNSALQWCIVHGAWLLKSFRCVCNICTITALIVGICMSRI